MGNSYLKWLKWGAGILVLAVIGGTYNNCSKYSQKKAVQAGDPINSDLCPAEIQAVQSRDPFFHSKINFSPKKRKSGIGTLSSPGIDFKKGTEVVAVVSHECLKTQQGGPFSGKVKSGERRRSHNVKIPRDMSLEELQLLAESDPCLVGLSDAMVLKTVGLPSDPRVKNQKHLVTIKGEYAWDFFLKSESGITKDVVLAVIDTGVDLDHEDLSGRLWKNTKEIPGNGVDDDDNGYVDDVYGYNFASDKGDPRPEAWPGSDADGEFHGTHVAGLAAAAGGNNKGGSGVMGEHLKIMTLNVFGADADARTADIENAIRYAADNGADVINMSLGGCGVAASLGSAIGDAIQAGVTVVVAAGNEDRELSTDTADSLNCDEASGKVFYTPASFIGEHPEMINVGSIDASDVLERSSFSNYGKTVVSIGSPGSDSTSSEGIFSSLPNNQYGRMRGTSMATPIVAGAFALLSGWNKTFDLKYKGGALRNEFVKAGRQISQHTGFFEKGRILDLQSLMNLAKAIKVDPPPDPAGECP